MMGLASGAEIDLAHRTGRTLGLDESIISTRRGVGKPFRCATAFCFYGLCRATLPPAPQHRAQGGFSAAFDASAAILYNHAVIRE
ncbi:putative protein OS=Eoetvoesiella caeni OX=645616 GN=DFR37_101395 PE=4 SV=1 [Eoetvoesiella caeni]